MTCEVCVCVCVIKAPNGPTSALWDVNYILNICGGILVSVGKTVPGLNTGPLINLLATDFFFQILAHLVFKM